MSENIFKVSIEKCYNIVITSFCIQNSKTLASGLVLMVLCVSLLSIPIIVILLLLLSIQFHLISFSSDLPFFCVSVTLHLYLCFILHLPHCPTLLNLSLWLSTYKLWENSQINLRVFFFIIFFPHLASCSAQKGSLEKMTILFKIQQIGLHIHLLNYWANGIYNICTGSTLSLRQWHLSAYWLARYVICFTDVFIVYNRRSALCLGVDAVIIEFTSVCEVHYFLPMLQKVQFSSK